MSLTSIPMRLACFRTTGLMWLRRFLPVAVVFGAVAVPASAEIVFQAAFLIKHRQR